MPLRILSVLEINISCSDWGAQLAFTRAADGAVFSLIEHSNSGMLMDYRRILLSDSLETLVAAKRRYHGWHREVCA
jgi:hypothetical protein